jgi:hypothetical protein
VFVLIGLALTVNRAAKSDVSEDPENPLICEKAVLPSQQESKLNGIAGSSIQERHVDNSDRRNRDFCVDNRGLFES